MLILVHLTRLGLEQQQLFVLQSRWLSPSLHCFEHDRSHFTRYPKQATVLLVGFLAQRKESLP